MKHTFQPTRRQFVGATALAIAGAPGRGTPADIRSAEAGAVLQPGARRLPRWRGFNLLGMYTSEMREGFPEADFAWIAEWGFDFVRLPLSYTTWANPSSWLELREKDLERISAAVELGRKHGLHVNLNLHRAPGYCVNPPKEPLDLWTDERALDACAFHWATFARRFRGIPNERLSFDLLNEPANVEEAAYVRVVKRLVSAIREVDPGRLIIADGLRWGRDPVHGLADLGIAQSTRGYDPMLVSHYRASWVQASETFPVPTWPILAHAAGEDGKKAREGWDRERLRKERIAPWKELEAKGVGIHVGEWGAFQHTPHPVVLAWMKDQLALWKEAGWGWALWNFRGGFGVLDSNRKDVEYEDFRGHKLDRKMLEVLRAG